MDVTTSILSINEDFSLKIKIRIKIEDSSTVVL